VLPNVLINISNSFVNMHGGAIEAALSICGLHVGAFEGAFEQFGISIYYKFISKS
jgi:hypothetical protein